MSSDFVFSRLLKNNTQNKASCCKRSEVKTLNLMSSWRTQIKYIAKLVVRKPLVCKTLVFLDRLLLNQSWLTNFFMISLKQRQVLGFTDFSF